jgi:SAM-dependent methyltransferase
MRNLTAMSGDKSTGTAEKNPEVLKHDVAAFWDSEPCGSETSSAAPLSQEYFDEIANHRYTLERHIPKMARFSSHAGERVLEVGCGIGTDAMSFARAGAQLTAVDASPKSLEMTRRRFELSGLPATLLQGDAEVLPFPDNAFDFVYSHGVLHHTPSPGRAIAEIRRVLRPGGSALVMLYHRGSYNYLFDILVMRRFGWYLLKLGVPAGFLSRVTGFDRQLLEDHRSRARSMPFDKQRFLNDNTDGPGNPLSQVFSRSEAARLFTGFVDVRTTVRYFDKRHVPVVGGLIPNRVADGLGRVAGWHLYISARKPVPVSSAA